jgi:hypothetical protein
MEARAAAENARAKRKHEHQWSGPLDKAPTCVVCNEAFQTPEARASLEAEVERMRKAAKRVVAEAETDDNWEGEYTDFLVPGDAFDALRAALEEPTE